MNKRLPEGFTLVELLIAMTILVAIISSAVWAHRFFLNQWERLSNRSNVTARQTILLQEISTVLSSTANYTFKYGQNDAGFLWKGTGTMFSGVSQSSLYFPGKAAVYFMSFDNDQGRCILRYSERPLREKLPDFNTLLNERFENSVSIQFKTRCSAFSYLGWEPRPISSALETGPTFYFPIADAKWFNVYDGLRNTSLPLSIRLTLVGNTSPQLDFMVANTLVEQLVLTGGSSE